MTTIHNSKKEVSIINFPDDNINNNNCAPNKPNIYELLIQTDGDYKRVSKILDAKIEETNELINELTANIETLPEQYFDEKLQKLKQENRETMMLCEEFQKIADRKDGEKYGNNSSIKLIHKPPKMPTKSTKPNMAINSHLERLNLTDLETDNPNQDCYKRLDKLWKEYGDLDLENIKKRERNYKREANQDRLYRPNSTMGDYYNNKDKGDDKRGNHQDNDLVGRWKHKITVPQPFSMTIRDEYKHNAKSRQKSALEQFHLEKAEKERKELEETKKQFKANPVPAHVYIPMYTAMLEESLQRRQLIRDYNKDILKSMEKPFNFYKRDMLKRNGEKSQDAYDSNSLPNKLKNNSASNKNEKLRSYAGEREKTIIRARPVPQGSKENVDMEKLKEDELFRRIKSEMRAKKLIEESKLPGAMEERQRLQEQKRLRRLRKIEMGRYRDAASSQDPPTSRNKLRGSVPDFNKIHKEWEREIRMSAQEPQFTQPKPFKLLAEDRCNERKRQQQTDLTRQSSNSLLDLTNRDVGSWNTSIMKSLEMPKPSTTKATVLRERAFRLKKQEEDTRNYQKAMDELAKKQRESEMSCKIRNQINGTADPSEVIKQSTVKKKLEKEVQCQDYQKYIEDLKHNVYNKPLLLETAKGTHRPSSTQYQTSNSNARSTRDSKFPDYDPRDQFGDLEVEDSYHDDYENYDTEFNTSERNSIILLPD